MKNEPPSFFFTGSWQSPIPNDIIRNRNISSQARFLWAVLRSFASPDNPTPFPKISTLVDITRWTDETVSKYIDELEVQGLMRVRRAKFKPNLYILTDKKLPDTAFSGVEGFRTPKEPGSKITTVQQDNQEYKKTRGEDPQSEAIAPTLQEVQAYARNVPQGPISDEVSQRFFAYYEGNRKWFNNLGALIDWKFLLLDWWLHPRGLTSTPPGRKSSVAPDYSNPGWGTQTPYVPQKPTK